LLLVADFQELRRAVAVDAFAGGPTQIAGGGVVGENPFAIFATGEDGDDAGCNER